jgi:hypothetical protein
MVAGPVVVAQSSWWEHMVVEAYSFHVEKQKREG